MLFCIDMAVLDIHGISILQFSLYAPFHHGPPHTKLFRHLCLIWLLKNFLCAMSVSMQSNGLVHTVSETHNTCMLRPVVYVRQLCCPQCCLVYDVKL